MKNKPKHAGGRPPLPPELKLRRRPIGLLPAQWNWLAGEAQRASASTDEIIRRMIEQARAG